MATFARGKPKPVLIACLSRAIGEIAHLTDSSFSRLRPPIAQRTFP